MQCEDVQLLPVNNNHNHNNNNSTVWPRDYALQWIINWNEILILRNKMQQRGCLKLPLRILASHYRIWVWIPVPANVPGKSIHVENLDGFPSSWLRPVQLWLLCVIAEWSNRCNLFLSVPLSPLKLCLLNKWIFKGKKEMTIESNLVRITKIKLLE